MLASSKVRDVLGFGIMCECEMNVRMRQNRLGCGVRREYDRAGSRRLSRHHMQYFIFNGVGPS